MKYDVVKLEINKLELKENDYLIMKLSDCAPEEARELAEFMKTNFSELSSRLIIIVGDVEIYVAKLEEEALK